MKNYYYIFLFYSFCFASWQVSGQAISFNQYNGCLAALNPAYIANIDRDQASYISRYQWPSYQDGSEMQQFGINKFIYSINSGFGLIGEKISYRNKAYESKNLGLQYGYRIIFLDDFVFGFGASFSLENTTTDINNFRYRYEPKVSFTEKEVVTHSGNYGKMTAGIIFQEKSNKYCFGLSLKNKEIYSRNDESMGRLYRSPTLIIHASKRFDFDYDYLFLSVNYERAGKYYFKNGADSLLQNSYNYFLFQTNLIIFKKINLGLGYKIFEGNYGSPHFRIGYSPHVNRVITFGYSYDVLPYIQNDKIHGNSSHEFYLKILLPFKSS